MKTMYIIGILATLIIASFGVSVNSKVVDAIPPIEPGLFCYEGAMGPFQNHDDCLSQVFVAQEECFDCCDDIFLEDPNVERWQACRDYCTVRVNDDLDMCDEIFW